MIGKVVMALKFYNKFIKGSEMVYPLKFKSICKEKIWGGNQLVQCFDCENQGEKKIGESWEICSDENVQSVVVSGKLKGKTIRELLLDYRKEIFGADTSYWADHFPLLIKFIDAKKKLSVQVHPDDDYALKHEKAYGKTEMWYVVKAKSGAELICGLKENISKEMFVEALKNHDIESVLKKVHIKSGDLLYIPAGTVHSVGEGMLLVEIQENSDVTYRLFDWNRLGIDGKLRETHVKKALDVINFSQTVKDPIIQGLVIEEENFTRTICVSCNKFTTEVFDIHSEYEGDLNGSRCEILISVGGDFIIEYADGEEIELLNRETVLMPATLGKYRIRGEGRFIRTYIMPPHKLLKELMKKGIPLSNIRQIKNLGQFI